MRPLTISLFAVTCLGLAGSARPDAEVVVRETGGFGEATIRTVRTIAGNELRKHGIAVREDGASAAEPAAPAGAAGDAAVPERTRVFVLRLGRLDEKVPVSLEETEPGIAVPLFVASHTMDTIDEADVVVPRLVRAVLRREPVEAGAEIDTVTARESLPFQKKPGEGLWVAGLGLAPLGGSFGWSYEAKQWRLGALFQGADDGSSFVGIDGAWIPRAGAVSPYVGVGLGAVGDEEAVLGVKLEVGVEFFRLHGVRLLAGANAIVPFQDKPGNDSFSPGLHLRLCF